MEVHLALGIGPDVISAMYPAWKMRLWRQLAEDAKSKKAFPDYHFDALGVLKSERPYHDLANWLAGLMNASKFDGFVPSWEHKGNGLWELYLRYSEEWVRVEPLGDRKARFIEPAAKYKLPRGGIVVQGLVPELKDEYDFCETEEDEFVDVDTHYEYTK